MNHRTTRNTLRSGAAAVAILFAAVAVAADRTGSERAVGGVTPAERMAAMQQLHGELTLALPAALGAPVSVGITQADRDAVDNPGDINGRAPLRIGVVKAAAININKGVWGETAAGDSVWAVTVTSPGAQAIRVQFKNFSLPANAEMFFLNSIGQVDGPYTGTGRNGTGSFWSRSLVSGTGTILLRFNGQATKADRRNVRFVVTNVAHIRGRPPLPLQQNHDSWPCSDNAPCVVDVNCVNTGPAGPAEDAVAKLEWIQGPFVNTCSGGLLADTDPGSQIPYFLTANHCFSSSNSSMETFFNYTTDSCNGSCPDNLVSGGTPPPSDTVGVTVVASGSGGDFTLVTLDQAPPAGAVFLGWNNAPIAFTNGAGLYRISNPNFGPQAYSQHDVDTGSPQCTGWPRGERIYSGDQTGATMGGSSGSPVLNSASEVVGQLSGCCGFDCADECAVVPTNWTVDGALAFYWDSVSEFLDPAPGCTGDPECDDGLFCTGTETCVSGSCQSSGDPCTGGTVCNEATDSCDAAACDNNGSCDAGEDCNNCPNDCRAKVNGNPNSRFCCDGDLTDCGDSRCSEAPWACGGSGGGCTTDPDCDDGQFCNGAETCAGGTCQSGSDPCPGEGCDEATDQCAACGQVGDSCVDPADCCSDKCKGKAGAKTCK